MSCVISKVKVFSTHMLVYYCVLNLYLIVYSFEILNSFVQLLIFLLLGIEYLLILVQVLYSLYFS